jgi:uncharacterized RDD family membrane protein YckC
MFCPSCGARNATGARTCAECGRALPAPRPGSTAPIDVAPTIHDAPKTVADSPGSSPRSSPSPSPGPAPAPAQPPRILKKPAPLAPAPIDVVPRNPAPPAASSPRGFVKPEDPTLVRRQPPAPAPVPVTPSSAQRHVAVSSPPPIQTGELAATRPLRPTPVTMPSNPPSPPASADVPFPSPPTPARAQAPASAPPSFAAPSTQVPSTQGPMPRPARTTGGETEPLPRAPSSNAGVNAGANGASARAEAGVAKAKGEPAAAPPAPVSSPDVALPARPVEAKPHVELSKPAPSKPSPSQPAPLATRDRGGDDDDEPVVDAKPVEARSAPASSLTAADAGTDVTAQAPAYQPPENVVLDVTHGLRWAASSLLDTALGAAFAAGAAALLLDRKGVRLDVQPIVDFIHKSPPQAVILIGGGAFVGLSLYQVLTVAILGGTVGQRVLGLRVLRLKDGRRAGIVRSIIRGFLCAGGALFLLAGPLFGVFLDRKRRGFGDFLARTVVARPLSGLLADASSPLRGEST